MISRRQDVKVFFAFVGWERELATGEPAQVSGHQRGLRVCVEWAYLQETRRRPRDMPCVVLRVCGWCGHVCVRCGIVACKGGFLQNRC